MADRPRQATRLPTGLMARMADTLRANLIAAQERGTLAPDAVKRMQNHCGACSDPEICERLLDQGTLKEAPRFCPNRNILHHLAKN